MLEFLRRVTDFVALKELDDLRALEIQAEGDEHCAAGCRCGNCRRKAEKSRGKYYKEHLRLKPITGLDHEEEMLVNKALMKLKE